MNALVTGAAKGLAAAVAVSLARGGGFERIVLTYRNASPQSILDEIASGGVAAGAHRVDFLGDAAGLRVTLAQIVADDGPFDVLVHGVGPMVVGRFAEMTLDVYREMFDGNVRSALLAVQAVLPSMRQRQFGRIVLFGANGSSVTRPAVGLSLHLAAKSALVAFARTLALEEAPHGVTVNVIEPGDIREKSLSQVEARARTAKNPVGRPGTGEDVAAAVRFLVDPDRDFVTGAVLSVTGGLLGAYERT
ncbi:MAG: SDR family NAD(P)-dependent oxidoreductase [Vulcanimicrobiaceae bacterium]